MTETSDNASRIHKRYTLTLFHPPSFYQSMLFAAIVISFITLLVHTVYLPEPNYVLILPMIVALFATQFIDSRFTLNKEYSKSVHLSLFSSGLWFATVGVGYLSSIIFQTPLNSLYIVEGMFIFAAFRIGLFTTTLGISLTKSWMLCMLQPLMLFFILIPPQHWIEILFDPIAILFGTIFLIVASTWSVQTDHSGGPNVGSTHKVIQTYLMSVKGDNEPAERLMEDHSKSSNVLTSQLRLHNNTNNIDFRLVLPDIHPGPYHPIGGSNMPYLLYRKLNSSAMIMHSISDHSLNLPSKTEVENYLQSLSSSLSSTQGTTCTEPVSTQFNKARVTGIRFDKIAILFLSLSPHGMEDLPNYVRSEIESMAKSRGFDHVLTVDCHNAMGEEINDIDSKDMFKATKVALDDLISKKDYPIEFGYANSQDMNLHNSDLGMGGISILCMKINNKEYFLGWADSNNMENGLREYIVNKFKENDMNLLELCTSDTHYSRESKVRNRNGYYHFGLISSSDSVSNWYLELGKKAKNNIVKAEFELLTKHSKVKITGPSFLNHLSKAVDNSMRITKIYFLASFGFFIFTLLPLFH